MERRSPPLGSWSTRATLAGTATTWTDTSILSLTTYEHRIRSSASTFTAGPGSASSTVGPICP